MLGVSLANPLQVVKGFFIYQSLAPPALDSRHAEPHTPPTLDIGIPSHPPLWRSADKDYITDKSGSLKYSTDPSHLTGVTVFDMPLCSGRFSDVYMGEWKGYRVCLKSFRLSQSKSIQIFSKEVKRWRQFNHHNVLPFYGICQNNNQISLVTPWMKNGNIIEYLKYDQTSNRVQFVTDVALGLEYLHKNGIVHGNLKGKNVLVGEDGHAVLADFGITSVLNPDVLVGVSIPSSVTQEGTARWRAPETFNIEDDEELPDTTSSDVYAFAMVAYEILANQLPFSQFKVDVSIMRAVVEGKRPSRPPTSSESWSVWGLTDNMWSIMESCWLAQSEKRPTVRNLILCFSSC